MTRARVMADMLVLIALGVGIGYIHHAGKVAGRNEIQILWDADTIKREEGQRVALIAYADKVRGAQEQHDKDQATIDRIAADAGRVRVHLPSCPEDASRKNPDGSAGILRGRTDALFAEFQGRIGRIVARCDQLNIDAIRANNERE